MILINIQHGADPTKKNRDGHTPLDLVKDGGSDVEDLLRGRQNIFASADINSLHADIH